MKSLNFLGTIIEGSSRNLGIAQQWSKQYQNYLIAPLLIKSFPMVSRVWQEAPWFERTQSDKQKKQALNDLLS
jgi:hypothetical protein